MKMKNVFLFLAVAGLIFAYNFASASDRATFGRNDLREINDLGQPNPFHKIAVAEGLAADMYNHFGNTTATAQKLCALTEKYYALIGLDKPYPKYVSRETHPYVSCWNDYNHIWKNGDWVTEGACWIGSYIKTVTCEAEEPAPIVCSSNSDCGVNGYVGNPYCSASGDVYQTYRTYTCNNPGTANSKCTHTDTDQLKTDCTGSQICQQGQCVNVQCNSNSDCSSRNGYIGDPYCFNGNVYQTYRTYACQNPGTINSTCIPTDAGQLKNTCTAAQTCSGGSCINQNIRCNTNSDCGTNGYTGSPFCQNGNVYQNYTTYTCNNPGTAYSSCSNNSDSRLKTNCTGNQVCDNSTGTCQTQNDLVVSCYATPNQASPNQQVSFIATATGGTGNYAYSWSGACTGSGQVCTKTFSYPCTQSATVTIYSNGQIASTVCSATIAQNCTSHSYQQCLGNNLYWYDSCGNQQESQYCQYGCSGNNCSNYQNNCTYHSQTRCVSNSVYWYDSCGNQQDLMQICQYNQTCQNGYCQQNQYQNAALTANETVRNLSAGNSGWSSTAYASPSDVLMFMISIQAPQNQDVHNVVVRDAMPTNFIYNNQLVVSGTNYNYGGNIVSGINLNTIPAGSTVTITYQVQLAGAQNFSYGTTTVNDNASASSNELGYIPVNDASIVVTRSAVYGASSVSTGLTNNLMVDSFALPLGLALLGLWLFRSGLFGIEKWADERKSKTANYRAEKQLKTKIAQIKKAEAV